jgi:hypothetical protein
MSETTTHPPAELLLAYWLRETDAAATDTVDEHLLQCDACGRALDDIVALGEGVREALRAGAVATMTSHAFVQRLAAQGLRIREYRLLHNGSVNCTVAPDDELLVSFLEAPLQGVQRLDATVEFSFEPGVRHELHDIPFDARAGKVVQLVKAAQIKTLPEHVMCLTLMAVEAGRARAVGRYEFRHRPWRRGR